MPHRQPAGAGGIRPADVRLGIVSFEYLDLPRAYRDQLPGTVPLVIAGRREAAVDDLLRQTIRSPRVETATYQSLREELAQSQAGALQGGHPLILAGDGRITMVVAPSTGWRLCSA